MAKGERAAKEGAGGAADALRDAVERTFQGAAGGAAATQKRAQELFDDVTSAVQRLRVVAVDERPLLDAVESLREEVRALSRRVAALEASAPRPKTPTARS